MTIATLRLTPSPGHCKVPLLSASTPQRRIGRALRTGGAVAVGRIGWCYRVLIVAGVVYDRVLLVERWLNGRGKR